MANVTRKKPIMTPTRVTPKKATIKINVTGRVGGISVKQGARNIKFNKDLTKEKQGPGKRI